MITIRKVLDFVIANPGTNVNAILTHFGIGLEDAVDDADYFDREWTGGALLDRLKEGGYVDFVVTDRDGWLYTSTGKEWR